MKEGKLIFKDGSELIGFYEIYKIKPSLSQLTFISQDVLHPALTKDADLLKSKNDVVLITGLAQKNIIYNSETQTIICYFIEK
jgi:hypothetical protein